MRALASAGLGALFALGLAISGMTSPDKVIAFLDITGDWDPSLAMVMVVGIGLHAATSRLVLARGAPKWSPIFRIPTRDTIDQRLLGGAAIFGVGWGISGFCPGPAVVASASLAPEALVFVVGMALGMLLLHTQDARLTAEDGKQALTDG